MGPKLRFLFSCHSGLSNRAQSVKPLLSKLCSSTLPCDRKDLSRLNVERRRVAEAPRAPEAVRPSRPRRRRGIGAQAKSHPCSPASRRWRVLVAGSGQASAGFTVVSAVGTGPPHDGLSGDRPSNVECAVHKGGNPERGMASPTSPAGTSRSSGRTEHGDGRSAHGPNLRRRNLTGPHLRQPPTPPPWDRTPHRSSTSHA